MLSFLGVKAIASVLIRPPPQEEDGYISARKVWPYICIVSVPTPHFPPVLGLNWLYISSKELPKWYPSQEGINFCQLGETEVFLVGEDGQNLGVIFSCDLASAWLQASWTYSWG